MPNPKKSAPEKDNKKSDSSSLIKMDVDQSSSSFSPPPLDLNAGSGFDPDVAMGGHGMQAMDIDDPENEDFEIGNDFLTEELEEENSIHPIPSNRIAESGYEADEEADYTSPKKRPRSAGSKQKTEKGRKKKKLIEKTTQPGRRPRRNNTKRVNYGGMQEEIVKKESKGQETHDLFKPRDKEVEDKDNHKHFSYKGYEYGENDYAEFSGSDDSDMEGITRRIHAKKVSFKHQKEVKNKRGRTHNTTGFVKNKGMNNSHLTPDKSKGSGHHLKKSPEESGQNLIPTSDQYNKVLMAEMEKQIEAVVGRSRFDLQVYTFFYENNESKLIKDQLQPLLGLETDQVTMGMDKMLKGTDTPRVQKLVYELKYIKSGKEARYRGEVGGDLALGTLDKEEKEERKERKKKKKKKPRTVDMAHMKKEIKLEKVEEDGLFWDGDSSYRDFDPSASKKNDEIDQ